MIAIYDLIKLPIYYYVKIIFFIVLDENKICEQFKFHWLTCTNKNALLNDETRKE